TPPHRAEIGFSSVLLSPLPARGARNVVPAATPARDMFMPSAFPWTGCWDDRNAVAEMFRLSRLGGVHRGAVGRCVAGADQPDELIAVDIQDEQPQAGRQIALLAIH